MSHHHILNHYRSDQRPASMQEVAAQLKQGINGLKGSFFDLETGQVNYAAMKGSAAYEDYVQAASQLNHLDLSQLKSQSEKLTFWINIYNALTIHGIIDLGIEDSVREVRGFFSKVSYQVGGHAFSLDEIEHGILRQNQKQHFFARRLFGRGDPRLAFMLDEPEPRIHFTLVCGSKSCPPIGTYQQEKIEHQLTLAASGFVNSENVTLDREANRLGLSKIFQWYGKDFGTRDDLIRFLAYYRRNPEDQDWLKQRGGRVKVRWQEYDWGLNH